MRYWDTWLSDENHEPPIMDGGPRSIWWMVRIIMEKKSSGFDDVPLFDPPVDRKGVRTARVRCLSIWWWANA